MAFSVSRYLDSRARFGMKFGLDAMRALLHELRDPHRCAPALLIAGTNGKGSVVAYVDAVLRASGLRTGRYISPHLVAVNERIAVDGRDISTAALGRHLQRVRAAAERADRARRAHRPADSFRGADRGRVPRVRRRGVDAMVLEVGLGGRLDATNVVAPLVSAIVSIDRDHEAYLGTTLAAIAREKAGVMRRGVVTVRGPLPAAALRTVEREARRAGARLVAARGALRRFPGAASLPGRHQRQNLEVALRVLEAARQAGLGVRLARAAAAVSSVQWPGRLQQLGGVPPLLLDGAHNPAAARALAAHLRPLAPVVLVFGMMADKDIEASARALFPLARVVILTRPRNKRAATPAQIRRRVASLGFGKRLRAAPGTQSALALARRLARSGETVVVSGSLYLVGEALRRAIPRATASPSRPGARRRRGRSRDARELDLALRAHGDRRIDEVLGEVACARRGVAGKRKAGQRLDVDVREAPDARLEHAAAPHRHRGGAARRFHLARHREAADPAHLDVDDAACPQLQGEARVLGAADRFVEAHRSPQLPLQDGVVADVVPRERLLDHHQVEGVELLQVCGVAERGSRCWRPPSAAPWETRRAPRRRARGPGRA